MVWTMQSDSEKTVGVVGNGEVQQPKRSNTKKYVIIGVTSVTVAVLLIIGLLVGIYLFTDAFNKIATQSLKTSQNTNQEVTADLTANIIQYNVEDKGVKAVYVEDYNSFLTVVKLTKDKDVQCYVTFMNGTEKMDMSKVGSGVQKEETNETVDYMRIGAPIPDISFMNKKARNLCQGISTYWVQRSCHQSKDVQKVKRAVCRVCVYSCTWLYGTTYRCRYICYYVNC